jgi:hypothetical protein
MTDINDPNAQLGDPDAPEELLLHVLVAIGSLCRSEHLDPDLRFSAIAQTITQAIGGNGTQGYRDAVAFADQVVLGLLE